MYSTNQYFKMSPKAEQWLSDWGGGGVTTKWYDTSFVGVMKMFYVLAVVVVRLTCTSASTLSSGHLRGVHFSM